MLVRRRIVKVNVLKINFKIIRGLLISWVGGAVEQSASLLDSLSKGPGAIPGSPS